MPPQIIYVPAIVDDEPSPPNEQEEEPTVGEQLGDNQPHTFHYITCRDGELYPPPPPVVPSENPPCVAVRAPIFPPIPVATPTAWPTAYGLFAQPPTQIAYGYLQQQPVQPAVYHYPAGFGPYACMPPAAPGMAHVPVPAYTPPDKKDDKKKKEKKKKSDKGGSEHHAWYGRTAAQVQYDDMQEAQKEGGANAPKELKPVAKPRDQFWVVAKDGARYLRAFAEIENGPKGTWHVDPAGGSFFVRAETDDEDANGGWAT